MQNDPESDIWTEIAKVPDFEVLPMSEIRRLYYGARERDTNYRRMRELEERYSRTWTMADRRRVMIDYLQQLQRKPRGPIDLPIKRNKRKW